MAEGAAGLVESQRYDRRRGKRPGERLRRFGELAEPGRAQLRGVARERRHDGPLAVAQARLARRARVCEPGQRLAREARHEVDRPRRRPQRLQGGRREPPSGLGGARIRQCAARRRAAVRSLADGAPHEQHALRRGHEAAPVPEELPAIRDPRGERRHPHAERAAAVRERAACPRGCGRRGHQHRGHGPAVGKVAGAGHGGAQGRSGVFGCDGSVRHGAIVTAHRAGNALEWRPCRRTS